MEMKIRMDILRRGGGPCGQSNWRIDVYVQCKKGQGSLLFGIGVSWFGDISGDLPDAYIYVRVLLCLTPAGNKRRECVSWGYVNAGFEDSAMQLWVWYVSSRP
jgi:hypothetical protein